MVKNPSVNAEAARDRGSTAGSERCLGEGNSNGNPLQDSWPGESHGQRSLAGL